MYYTPLCPQMRKAEREKAYVTEVGNFGFFDVGSMEQREQPDFVAVSRGQRIGLELTELLDKASGKGRIDSLSKLPEKARALCESPEARSRDVVVAFVPDRISSASAKDLARFVEDYCNDCGDHRANLPRGFCFIWIEEAQHGSPGVWKWAVNSVGETGAAPHELVQRVIDGKRGKLDAYRKNLPGLPIWLIVVNDQMRASHERIASPEDLQDWTFQFNFDRVLFYRRLLEPLAPAVFDLHSS